MRKLNKGAYVPPTKATVESYVRSHLDQRRAMGKIRERTHLDYLYILDTYITPAIGHRRLDKVTPQEIEALYASLHTPKEDGGRGLSAASVRHVHIVLNNAFKKAEKQRILPFNPAAATERPAVKGGHDRPALTPSEAQRFFDALEGTRWEALFSTLLYTGMRPGEALALQWESVDLEAGTILVQRALATHQGKVLGFAEPKTNRSRRTIRIEKTLAELLKQHRAAQAAERLAAGPAYESGDLVFCTQQGRPLMPRNLNRTFKRFLKAAGLPDAVRMYDLRHSNASLRRAAGHDLVRISRDLGHRSIELTADTYTHLFEEEEIEAARSLERLLSRSGTEG